MTADGLLEQTPEAAVGQIVLGLLDSARAALDRLIAGTDPEALHDFRVAVRRLRSTASAWRKPLRGRLSKEDRAALRAVQQQTGGARDAEVALSWLDKLPAPDPAHAPGYDALRDRLGTRVAGDGGAHDELVEAFGQIEARLRETLATTPQGQSTFARGLAKRIRRRHKQFRKRLRRAFVEGDPDEAHRARVLGKRLRYLVEPAIPVTTSGKTVVKVCKRLQDILGDLNDARVLGDDVERTMREHAGPDDRPGFEDVLTRTRARHEALSERFRSWMDTERKQLADAVRDLVRELKLASADFEIERTYLLRSLPVLPPRATAKDIRQGYLPPPGPDVEDRVRAVQDGTDVRYVRTIKSGTGLTRRELESTLDEGEFEALWQQTEGRRVHKRRHVVQEHGRAWEIDEFLDRDLVLAEVELASADEDAPLPGWLAEHLDREVTDDLRYANANLAC